MSKTPDFFNRDASLTYDERNRPLAPLGDAMHFLIRLVLKDLPPQARVLCVGVGTGAEIFSLSQAFPEWTFVGVDPSAPMLEVCRAKLKSAGITSRCELIEGYVQDVPLQEPFDAVLSILVGHFVARAERPNFYKELCDRVRTGGTLVTTEISCDLQASTFPDLLESWKGVQTLMGATPESLAKLPQQLREILTVLPPSEVQTLLRQSGISVPTPFFQASLICGWFGKKA